MKPLKESVRESLNFNPISGNRAGSTASLPDKAYTIKKEFRIKNSSYNATIPKGTKIVNIPGGVFAQHPDLEKKWPKEYDTKYGIGIVRSEKNLQAILDNS